MNGSPQSAHETQTEISANNDVKQQTLEIELKNVCDSSSRYNANQRESIDSIIITNEAI